MNEYVLQTQRLEERQNIEHPIKGQGVLIWMSKTSTFNIPVIQAI